VTSLHAACGELDDDHAPGTSSQGQSVGSEGASEACAKETMPEGEGASENLTALGDKGPSRDAAIGGEEEPINLDAKELKALKMGDRATSMFKSAMSETLQLKKMDSRDKYAYYLCICNGLGLTYAIGQSRAFTTQRLKSCGMS
jgi:hypothetical protein